ncbi:septation protein SepH [Humidisolicoccus flavus]|uniref:septation protein SepH n=1 Tax=Humidisolicoccus flavus TaxID=3111414 RepID=UPI003245812B
MQNLTVVGVDHDVLVLESPSGERFTVSIGELPHNAPRQSSPTPSATTSDAPERVLRPREIQAFIRGGLTAEEVAAQTGEELAYIERFEGAVLAEREHTLSRALAVPVHSSDIDPLAGATFGATIRERLADLRAVDQEWSSWKDREDGWIVRLRFTTEQVLHEAEWAFDLKKSALAARNKEAIALSQQADAQSVLLPRLRAVDKAIKDEEPQQPSRFDSGVFSVERGSEPESSGQPAEVQAAAIARAPRAATEPNHTADLLEALRRRRGEREAALAHAEDDADAKADALFDVEPTDTDDEQNASLVHHTSPLSRSRAGKGRKEMPSWDEIVFGSRTDES